MLYSWTTLCRSLRAWRIGATAASLGASLGRISSLPSTHVWLPAVGRATCGVLGAWGRFLVLFGVDLASRSRGWDSEEVVILAAVRAGPPFLWSSQVDHRRRGVGARSTACGALSLSRTATSAAGAVWGGADAPGHATSCLVACARAGISLIHP